MLEQGCCPFFLIRWTQFCSKEFHLIIITPTARVKKFYPTFTWGLSAYIPFRTHFTESFRAT